MAAKLPLTRHQPQPGETENNTCMPNRHQQTLLQPATTAAAAVCLTATSSLIQGWGTRVLHLLLQLLLPAAPQYLSICKVGSMKPGDTRAGPAVTLQSRAFTGLQGCYLSASRATITSWIVVFLVLPSITIMSALLCPQPTPLEHLSSLPIFPYPRALAPSVAIATAGYLVV